MKQGEKITIRRMLSGLYAIEYEGQPTLIGTAASTAAALNMLVFMDEGGEELQYTSEPEAA